MVSEAVFRQADLNADGRIDLGEFRNFVAGQNLGGVTSWNSSLGSLGWGAGLGSAGWSSAGLGSAGWSSAGWGGDAYLGGAYGASYGGAYGAAYGGSGLTGYESYGGSAGLVGDASLYLGGGSVVDSSALAVNQVHYATDAQGLYQDPNPHVITRANPSGVQTYTQNVQVRFLQPPPVPPHGPLIIREVRPAQPPVPPPLHLRQVAPPLPQPPPLVLREHPPAAPGVIASQTVIRRLPGIPVPPRSVIVERVPPAPPRPRDIFVERWLPYGPRAPRRTLLQRAAAPAPYPAPRNVIVQYEQAPARVVRQVNNLGVASANPAAYVQTYGASLLDSASLVSHARAAGVVEDISARGYVGYGLAAYGQGLAGGEVLDGGLALGGAYGYGSGLAYGGGLGYGSGSSWGYGSGLGYGASLGYGGGLGYGSSWGYGSGLGYGAGLGYGGSWGGVSGTDAAFLSADTNLNGSLDPNEFRNLLAANL